MTVDAVGLQCTRTHAQFDQSAVWRLSSADEMSAVSCAVAWLDQKADLQGSTSLCSEMLLCITWLFLSYWCLSIMWNLLHQQSISSSQLPLTGCYWVLLGVTGWVRFLHPGSLTVGSTAKMLGKEMRLPCCKHDHCCNQNDDCNHVITV